MPEYSKARDFRHDQAEGLGILLANLGTPDAPDARAVRRYLAEFLWDPRVVETPRWLWWLVLHGVILRVRPSRSAKAYRAVWTDQGSPLLVHGRAQGEALQAVLQDALPGPVRVEVAMRYGSPSIPTALEALREWGARRILVLPLYPQYSATTSASTMDAVGAVLRHWRWLPELRSIMHYHDEPGYIDALAASVREHWAAHGRPDRLLMSFHGLPRRYLEMGNPYYCQCHKTARLLAGALELGEQDWLLSFQSRVGREEWLRPYTDETLRQWGHEGVRRVQVMCPGFSADCLETLEEIAMQNRELFLESGGQEFEYIPALNERPEHLRLLTALVLRHVQGWPETQAALAADELTARRQRALADGAPG